VQNAGIETADRFLAATDSTATMLAGGLNLVSASIFATTP